MLSVAYVCSSVDGLLILNGSTILNREASTASAIQPNVLQQPSKFEMPGLSTDDVNDDQINFCPVDASYTSSSSTRHSFDKLNEIAYAVNRFPSVADRNMLQNSIE